ncbi:MAG: hypothetical protein ACRCX2_31465 [Paraclostridium sp.]
MKIRITYTLLKDRCVYNYFYKKKFYGFEFVIKQPKRGKSVIIYHSFCKAKFSLTLKNISFFDEKILKTGEIVFNMREAFESLSNKQEIELVKIFETLFTKKVFGIDNSGTYLDWKVQARQKYFKELTRRIYEES